MCGGGGLLPAALAIGGAIFAPELLPAIGIEGLGATGAAALGAGLGATTGGLIEGEKPLKALEGGAIAGGTAFAGGELLGSGASGAPDAASGAASGAAGAGASAPAGASAAGSTLGSDLGGVGAGAGADTGDLISQIGSSGLAPAQAELAPSAGVLSGQDTALLGSFGTGTATGAVGAGALETGAPTAVASAAPSISGTTGAASSNAAPAASGGEGALPTSDINLAGGGAPLDLGGTGLDSFNLTQTAGLPTAAAPAPAAGSTLTAANDFAAPPLLSGYPVPDSSTGALLNADSTLAGDFGTTGTNAGGGSGVLDFLKNHASLALPAAGLAYTALSGTPKLPNENQLQGSANTLAGQGATLQSYLTNGQLPPGMENALKTATASAKASIRSRYASMGLAGSSMEQAALAAVDDHAVTQALSMAQSLNQTGLTETGMANQLYTQIMQAQLQQDKGLQDAIGRFAMAAAGGTGRAA